jgi:hypothetical protein
MVLSNKAFLKHFLANEPFEFERVRSGTTDKVRPLKVFGSKTQIEFKWGSNEQIPTNQRPQSDIDREVADELIKRGLFHLKNSILIKVLPAKHARLGAYTSYTSTVIVYEKVRP